MPIRSKRKESRFVRVPPPPQHILQLKVSLRYIKPPIWRRILVPDNLPLGDLHYAIYPAMGWYGYHMHCFRFGGGFNPIEYASSETVEDCGPAIRHEDSVVLSQVIKRKGQTFSYEYDFGDGWQHEIKVEKLIPYDTAMRLPVCLAGARACPPEDCGGVRGYYHALEVLERASTPDEKSFREWLGNYDPEYFDLEAINQQLQPRKLPMHPHAKLSDLIDNLLRSHGPVTSHSLSRKRATGSMRFTTARMRMKASG